MLEANIVLIAQKNGQLINNFFSFSFVSFVVWEREMVVVTHQFCLAGVHLLFH